MAVQNDMYNQSEGTPKKSIKKWFIIGGIALFLILIVVANISEKKKQKALANQATEVVEEEIIPTEAEVNEAELEQQALIEVYGEPPEGFRWDDEGNPVAVSNENLTAEEVVYQYLKAVSLLDMATAEKYALSSTLIPTYYNLHGIEASQSYYTKFARKMYAEALTSIESDGTEREAVFANGRRVYTINMQVLDLSYKDFWKDNQEELFETLHQYLQGESDSTKAQEYIYDKILEYYSRDDAKKQTVQVDITLDRVTKGGWLVTDDMDLDMICQYKDGTTVYEYIMACYEDYLQEKYAD